MTRTEYQREWARRKGNHQPRRYCGPAERREIRRALDAGETYRGVAVRLKWSIRTVILAAKEMA